MKISRLETWKFGNPEILKFGNPEIRKFGNPETGKSGVRESGNRDPESGNSESQNPECGKPQYITREPGNPGIWNPEFPLLVSFVSRNRKTNLKGFRIPHSHSDFPIPASHAAIHNLVHSLHSAIYRGSDRFRGIQCRVHARRSPDLS